ncbi:MAG: YkgJ family cysteine cluster protein [Rhodopila sp.]|jgi:hypothetical protein
MDGSKIRRNTAGTLIERVNTAGATVPFKQAGVSYSVFQLAMAKRCALPLGQDAKVPCRGCTACCYHSWIAVDRAVEPAERLAHLGLVPDELGDMQLRHADTGACVHLGPQGCTVYEHRPTICRSYDCRMIGFFSLAIDHGNGHQEPNWEFGMVTAEDKAIKAAITYLVMLYRAEHSGPVHAVKAAGYVKANLAAATRHILDAWRVQSTITPEAA